MIVRTDSFAEGKTSCAYGTQLLKIAAGPPKWPAKTAGVQIQLSCTIIASMLLALATGGNLTRRKFEMVSLYFSGWADEEELLEALGKPPP